MADKNVTIKLGGDATGLIGALKSAGRETEVLGAAFAQMARGSGIQLSGQLQRTVKDLESLRNHLISTKAPAADLEKVTAKLTEAQLKFKDSLKTDAMKQQEAALDSLRSKYTEQNTSLSALGKTITDNRAGFQALGGVMTGVGTAITGSLGLAFNEFNKFNQGMREVNSLVNLGEKDFQKLSQQVINLSSKLGTDATGAVHGLYEALSAGVPADNAIGFLEVASKAAIGGVTDTKVAVDGLTTVINSWKLSTADADKVADQMFVTVKLGKTTFAELAASLSTVAPIAAATGVSFKEVMGAVTTLTKQGVPTAEAMTQIRASIVGIITPNKEMAALFQKIGVASGETLIKTRGLQGAYEDLAKASGGSNEVLTKALGRVEALGAVLSTTGQNAQGARDDLAAVGKSAGELDKAFNELQKGRAVELLLTQFKNLSIEIGAKLQPAISAILPAIAKVVGGVIEWVQENPTLTASLVAVGGAVGALMLTVGPLLFALPSMIEGFALVKGAALALGPALTAVGSAVTGAIASFGGLGALAGYTALIVAATAAIGGIVYAFMSWRDAVDGWRNANQGLDSVTHKLNAQLKLVGKEVDRGKLSWEEWTQKVQQAAKENSGLINKLGEQEKALKKTAPAALNAAQATAALAAKQAAQAEASKKAAKEIEGWGSALGVTIPKLRQTVAEGEKYVAYLKRNKASAEEVKEAERKLQDARLALTKATSPLIAETEKLLTATKDLDKAEISNLSTLAAAQRQAMETTETLRNLGVVAGTELPAEFGKPKSALLDLQSSFKGLGITSTAELRKMAEEAQAQFESIRADGKSSTRDIELAWAEMTQRNIDVTRASGAAIDVESQKAVDAIKSKYGDLKNDKDANLSTWRELASKQVSTLVSDVSKGFADILLSGSSFGSKIIGMFKQIGQGMMQGFFESGIGGLLSGKGLAGFGGFAGGLLDAIKGIGGGGKGGGLTSLAGLIPGLGGKGGLLAGLGGLGIGGGAAAGGLIAGGVGGSLASIAGAGAVPGFLLAGGTVAGTAGAAGVGGGLAAGGAAGGGLASTLGALATNPITIAAAAAIAGVLLTRRLTRRGREKEDATTQAEDMSGDVWQGIVPEVQAGRATIDEGIAAIQQRFADYEAWLRANLKDQTVITRSIEGQRITVTESIAALEQLRGKETEVAAKRSELEGLINQFTETGVISGALSDIVQELGGSLQAFQDAARIPELEKLQSGFGGLRDELLKMVPATEDMFAAFLRTGEVSADLRKALDETGISAREQTAALLKMAEFTKATDNLQDFTSGIGSLREELGALAIPVLSAYESFVKLNEITPELRDEISRFGLDIEAFESFSAIKTLRDQFVDLRQSIIATGEGAAELKSIFESVGADTSILDSAGQIASLRAQQTELQAFMADLAKIAPPAAAEKSNLQRFIETGLILPDYALELQNKGVDQSKFGAFTEAKTTKQQMDDLVDEFAKTKVASQAMQDMAAKFNTVIAGSSEQMAAQLKTIQASTDANYKEAAAALGIEIGKLEESVTSEIAKLQKGLEDALAVVGTKLDTQFEDSRIALIGQLNTLETGLTSAVDAARFGLIGVLGKIDTHLTNAVDGLKTDLNTAINNLTAAINSVSIPGDTAPTTAPPQSTPPTTPEPVTHTGDRSSRGIEDYGFARYPPGFALGGVVENSGLAIVHRGETVLPPEMMASLLAGFQNLRLAMPVNPYMPQTSTAVAPATGAAAPKVEQTIIFQNVEDPYRQRMEMERVNANLVDSLARGA